MGHTNETTVMNLDAGEEHATYKMNARQSVLTAYAESRGNKNSWEYEEKYGHMVKKVKYGWVCGKFWAQADEDNFGEIEINPA